MQAGPTHTFELDVVQCHAMLKAKNPPLLIDCRELNEYTHCRIEGATLVPLSNFIGTAEEEFPSAETPAIIYCHHGVRSLNAVNYLREQGFTHSYSMAGGIDQWSLLIDQKVPRY
ncbi:MAG: rhodanese-like domain-containing protein [Rubritalea sp.]|uniref:rhodanese-like domain-containing protein n=1 Tax=Rubritalea sp. TaxID=2109375 RepID=UPI003241E4ED